MSGLEHGIHYGTDSERPVEWDENTLTGKVWPLGPINQAQKVCERGITGRVCRASVCALYNSFLCVKYRLGFLIYGL